VVASSTLPVVPLDSLRVGESGVVVDLDGPAVAVSRLQELGLRVGQRLKMLRVGPPHLVDLGEARLCFRPESEVVVLVGVGPG
jgi:ferrous iron transport protein A